MTSLEAEVPPLPIKNLPISISSYRLLYIYLLLAQTEQVFFEDLNTHLLNHPVIERVFTNETVNKYINTLRFFGCDIVRFEERGHTIYKMNDHPLKISLSYDEVKALQAVCNLLAQQPLMSTCKNFYFLIHRLCRFPEALSPNPMSNLGLNIQPLVSRHMFQLAEQFQRYCQEAQVLEICLKSNDDASTPQIIEPQAVVYRRKRLYLVGNDPKTTRKVRYDIEQIVSHRQLPNRVRSQTMKTTVIFKLTGRVALNYRPYSDEIVSNKGEFVLVKHQTDEVEQLLKRLLKYGPNCQVVSPESVRQEMLKLIEQLMQSMETPVDDVVSALASKAQTDETLHKWLCYLDIPQTSDGAKDG